MGAINFAHLAPAFTIGLLATLNPCVLPLYPGYLAYLAKGNHENVKYLGLMVLAGVMTMMLGLGALIALLTGALAQWSAILLQPLGAILMFLMGLFLVFDINPFMRVAVTLPKTERGQYTQAFLYGLLFGPMIMPCAAPLVISIFSLSIGIAGFIEQLLFFFIFGLWVRITTPCFIFCAPRDGCWITSPLHALLQVGHPPKWFCFADIWCLEFESKLGISALARLN